MSALAIALVLAIAPDASQLEWWDLLGPAFEEGRALYEQGDYAAAAQRFSNALPANPYACLYNRGQCHARLGRWELAAADFAGAAELATDRSRRARAFGAHAAVRLRADQPDLAMSAIHSALQLNPLDPRLQLVLAGIHEARDQPRLALAALDEIADSALAAEVQLRRDLLRHRLGLQTRLLGIDPTDSSAWRTHLDSLAQALRLRPDLAALRTLAGEIARLARAHGDLEVASAAEALLGRAPHSPLEPSARAAPPLLLDEELVPGEPIDPAEPSRWEDYAHRWELLVLLGVVLGILAIYLRIRRERKRLTPPLPRSRLPARG